KHGQLLGGRVGEDEELVAGPAERLDRLVDRHRLRRHPTGDETRPGAITAGVGRLLGGEGACPRRSLVLLPLRAQLLRLVLELRAGEIDRRVEVGGLLLREHRHVIGLEGDLGGVALLRDREDHVRIDRTAEILLHHPLELVFRVGPERGSRVDVPERDVDLHEAPLPRAPAPRRAWIQYAALRFDDGRMPINSRYFATVRRAMSISSFANISAMCWSEYGFLLPSAAMMFRILSLTLSAETSSPCPLRR